MNQSEVIDQEQQELFPYSLETELTPYMAIVYAPDEAAAKTISEHLLAEKGIDDPYYLLFPITIH